jgi:hypothetical protein
MNHLIQVFFQDKLRAYKTLSFLLAFVSIAAVTAAFFFAHQDQKQHQEITEDDIPSPAKDAPFYNQVMSLIEPLQYSGLQALLRSEVSLQVDFVTHTWQLKNIHRFDRDGHIMLDENRYGLCGELASFVYPKAKSLLGPEFDIEFAQVAESGFFLQPQSSHIALLIHDRKTEKIFLLDPSFHRYGRLESFDNYLFYDRRGQLDFMTNQATDVSFDVESGTPILIRNNRIVFLTVEELDGKFNENNFTIALTATKRYHYAGRYVFLVRKKDGELEVLENLGLAEKIFPLETYKKLTQKILFWATNQN